MLLQETNSFVGTWCNTFKYKVFKSKKGTTVVRVMIAEPFFNRNTKKYSKKWYFHNILYITQDNKVIILPGYPFTLVRKIIETEYKKAGFNINDVVSPRSLMQCISHRWFLEAILLNSPADFRMLYITNEFSRELTFIDYELFKFIRYEDLHHYVDNPEEYLDRLREMGYSKYDIGCRNYVLVDILPQAIILQKKIKASWSDRKFSDMHHKWTYEIKNLMLHEKSEKHIWKTKIDLPEGINLLNSERDIFFEGTSMHHCIYECYFYGLQSKDKIAFHVNNSGDPFTVMFNITQYCIDSTPTVETNLNQAYHAYNKELSLRELEMIPMIENIAIEIIKNNK